MNKVGILGVGLIGGSVGLELKKNASYIIGFDQNSKHLEKAKELGIIDKIGIEGNFDDLDILIVAIPVNATRKVLPDILDKIQESTTVIDMGSTKSGICAEVKDHKNRSNFVAAHPIAGTENSGPEAAISGLFKGKINIICEKSLSAKEHLNKALSLFELLEMKCLEMDPEEHDRHIAFVSHLSHISAFVLGQTVLEIEKDEKNIFNMAGSGFASTVRLAKSSPEMWGPIFQQNKSALLEALQAYITNLENFKQKIENGDSDGLIETMREVNRIRKVLDGITG
jgi:prephenate dehydrogenase